MLKRGGLDLPALKAGENLERDFDLIVRIRVSAKGADPAYAFGKGTAQLLQGVRELKSLNRAARELGMSYSKAWKSIQKTEEQLGFALLERRGALGSVLTGRGESFLELYLEMESAARAACEKFLRGDTDAG